MKCPYCGKDQDRVLDSRQDETLNIIRRKRECLNCSKRFMTIESVWQKEVEVHKKSGSIELFSKSKIKNGIIKACEKLNISDDQINMIVNNVEQRVFNTNSDMISSVLIGEFVMEELKKMDPVAYVRYAAIYKEFKDLDSWFDEIVKLKKSKENK